MMRMSKRGELRVTSGEAEQKIFRKRDSVGVTSRTFKQKRQSVAFKPALFGRVGAFVFKHYINRGSCLEKPIN